MLFDFLQSSKLFSDSNFSTYPNNYFNELDLNSNHSSMNSTQRSCFSFSTQNSSTTLTSINNVSSFSYHSGNRLAFRICVGIFKETSNSKSNYIFKNHSTFYISQVSVKPSISISILLLSFMFLLHFEKLVMFWF